MAQFVHHHIVDYFRGCQHQQTVEIQIPLAAAAAPSGALIADGDVSIGYPHFWGKIRNPLGNHLQRLGRQFFHLLLCKGRQGSGTVVFLQMLLDPVRLTLDESADVVISHPFRTPDHHLSRGDDLNGDGFPGGTDDLIGNGIGCHGNPPKQKRTVSPTAPTNSEYHKGYPPVNRKTLGQTIFSHLHHWGKHILWNIPS